MSQDGQTSLPAAPASHALCHAEQSVEQPCQCGAPRRPGGRLCRVCHATDMRTRRRADRRRIVKAGLARRRGRKDREL